MRKLTDTKCVYVILNTETQRVKIGIANDVKRRFENLRFSGGCDMEIVYNTPLLENPRDFETRLHTVFSKHRYIGEWFTIDYKEAIETVKNLEKRYRPCYVCETFKGGMNPTNIAKELGVSRTCIVKHLFARGYKVKLILDDKKQEQDEHYKEIKPIEKKIIDTKIRKPNAIKPFQDYTPLNISDMVAKNNEKLQIKKEMESRRLSRLADLRS